MWTLEEALTVVRNIDPILKPKGWFVGISGGVLLKGSSVHDLDLLFVPMDNVDKCIACLHKCLVDFSWKIIRTKEEMQEGWRAKGLRDNKHVEHWEFNNKRIDVIIVS